MRVASGLPRFSAVSLFHALAALAVGLALAGSAIGAPPTSGIAATRFAITLDGYEIASFPELLTISSSARVAAAPSGGLETVPTPSALVEVVLRRPMNRNIELAAWHELVTLGDMAAARKSVTLVAYDANGQPVARYFLADAWPSRLEIGTLKSGGSEVLMETVTMTCEFIQRVAV